MEAGSHIKNTYENLARGKFFIKGKRDSSTSMQVLAGRGKKKPTHNNCYWEYVYNLPAGTRYVDGEAAREG